MTTDALTDSKGLEIATFGGVTAVEEQHGYAPAAVWPVYRKWLQHEEWLEDLVAMLERHGVRVQVVPGGRS